jgi:hypothetical protein
MPVKKKPSAAQLAARAKFVKMVRAKAAAKKAALKVGAYKKPKLFKPTKKQTAAAAKRLVKQSVAPKKVAAKKVAGLDKITRKGKKTTVHYSRVSGVNGISLIGNVSNRKKIDILNFTKPEMVARLFLIVKDWSNLEDKIVLNKARALVWSRNTARENFIYPKIYEKKLTYNLLLYVMGNDNNLFSEAIK